MPKRNRHAPSWKKTCRAGYTIVELAIVLGIAGVLLSGVWIFTDISAEKQNIQRTTEDITITVQNLREVWQGRGASNGTFVTLTDQLIRANIIPADLVTNRADIAVAGANLTASNAWGGGFQINDNIDGTDGLTAANDGAIAVGGAQGMSFRIRLTRLPLRSCIAIATKLYQYGALPGLLGISINPDGLVNSLINFPVTVPAVTASCQAGNANVIDFIYRLRMQ